MHKKTTLGKSEGINYRLDMSRFKKANTLPASYIPYEECWAKTDSDGNPGMSVLDHCTITGYVARELISYFPQHVVEKLGDNPALIAALHDIGKVSPGFQLKYFRNALAEKGHPLAESNADYHKNHAAISELTLQDVFPHCCNVCPIAQVAGIHHGSREKLRQKSDKQYALENTKWPEERRKIIKCLENEFGTLGNQPQNTLTLFLLSGLTCVSDWIASDEELFSVPLDKEREKARTHVSKAIQSCGWEKCDVKPNMSFTDVYGFSPRPFQQQVAKVIEKPGVYIIEAPTGCGKTEAALYAAYQLMSKKYANGIYFGLPTRLTSDKIHERVNIFLDSVFKNGRNAKLAHGTAWLSRFNLKNGPTNNYKNDIDTWFNPLKRSLLHPFAVGTIDQALLSVLNVKHFFVRLFGLAGKVVILDEVHSYDMFTGTHLDLLVDILRKCDCTIIILSATLTAQRCKQLLNINTLENEESCAQITTGEGKRISSEEPPSCDVHIRVSPLSHEEISDLALQKARKGASVLCISNTVAEAQKWYKHICSSMRENECDVGLLHSKFITAHRADKEKEWLEKLGKNGDRVKGCILVATQVIEQSVDIDADFLITELAPTDMIIQRIGRVWRHERKKRPVPFPAIHIISQEINLDMSTDEVCEALGIPNTYVYSPYVLCRSREVWKKYDKKTVFLPADVRKLLNETYDEKTDEPEALNNLKLQQEQKNQKLERYANAMHMNTKGMPVGKDDEHAATRYNDRPMKDVIIVKSFTENKNYTELVLLTEDTIKISSYKRDIYAAAQMYENLLRIPSYLLPENDTPEWLAKSLNNNSAILECKDTAVLYADGMPTDLSYDVHTGLICNKISHKHTDKKKERTHNEFSDFIMEENIYELSQW